MTALFSTAGACATVAIVIGLGGLARDSLRGDGRYQVRFADLDCPPPEGLSRAEFLDEVRYLAAAPETVRLLDPLTRDRLAAAFAGHPWVGAVAEIDVRPRLGVRVKLRYREPVLLVRTDPPGDHGEPEVIAVDRDGVVLPKKAARLAEVGRLPVMSQSGPLAAAGAACENDDLRSAAKLAGYLRAEGVPLSGCRIRVGKDGLDLEPDPGRHFVWGRPPGGEPDAVSAEKARRLREWLSAGRRP